jgi:hypothetical protein
VTNDGDRFVRLLEIFDFLLGKFDIDCAYARIDQAPDAKETRTREKGGILLMISSNLSRDVVPTIGAETTAEKIKAAVSGRHVRSRNL